MSALVLGSEIKLRRKKDDQVRMILKAPLLGDCSLELRQRFVGIVNAGFS